MNAGIVSSRSPSALDNDRLLGHSPFVAMRTLSSDTSPLIEAVQIELLRSAGDARRARMCRSLTETIVNVSRRALRDQMPGADENAVLTRWVALNYGDVLAASVARRLEHGR